MLLSTSHHIYPTPETDIDIKDNYDYCDACSGNGELLCCDGCPRSFHFHCLDPPLDKEPDGEWLCPECVADAGNELPQVTGLLGPIIRQVQRMNPRSYALPDGIRNYFEGVRTGEGGEYEEPGVPKTQNNPAKMNRAGFIEEPDYKALKDSKGKTILCYSCKKSSNGREIIPCDFCDARWHLDCLDPPLAVPPRRRVNSDKADGIRTWRCPLHAETTLNQLKRYNSTRQPGDLGRIPKVRKPKHAKPRDAPFERGFRNNGVIDVRLAVEADPDLLEQEMFGEVWRVPENGIKLDFVDRIKR